MASTLRRCCAAASVLGASAALIFSHTGRTARCAAPPPLLPAQPRLQPLADAQADAGSGFHVHVVAPLGVRTAFQLFLANAGVWAAWQLQNARLRAFLHEWFMTRGGAYQQGSLPSALARSLLSSYSHSSLLHLGANMMGLFSFAPRCMDGRETPRTPKLSQLEFLGMYTAAGVAGGLGSTAFSGRLGTGRPGLGASGSIFAVLTYAVCAYPDSRVLLFFVLEMSAESALQAATALNVFLVGKEYLAARGRGACGCGPNPGAAAPARTPLALALPPSHTLAPHNHHPTHANTRPLSAGPPIMDGMAHLIGSAIGYAWFVWAAERAQGRRTAAALPACPFPRRGSASDSLNIPMPPGGSVSV